ncbi:MAG: hypothetical protein R3C26_02325 [Calditrichia bacterium]
MRSKLAWAVRKYVKLADSHDVDEILAVATAPPAKPKTAGVFWTRLCRKPALSRELFPVRKNRS